MTIKSQLLQIIGDNQPISPKDIFEKADFIEDYSNLLAHLCNLRKDESVNRNKNKLYSVTNRAATVDSSPTDSRTESVVVEKKPDTEKPHTDGAAPDGQPKVVVETNELKPEPESESWKRVFITAQKTLDNQLMSNDLESMYKALIDIRNTAMDELTP